MRVLIIEDEIKIAKALKRGLEQETFSVDIVFDGQTGLDMASTEPYDVIVLDLMLPKIDGIKVCSILREENVKTPIIMLTAKVTTEDKVKGLNCGADDYLVKPFSFEELLARIRALLRRPSETQSVTLECGSIKLDTMNYKATVGTDNVDLSKKEYALLEYLIRNKGKTITKDQIIEHVWSYDANVLPNTVEVYIGYLRNKIDKPYKTKCIKTVRGFGYVLQCNI